MLQHFQTLLARTVGLLFQGGLLDLHLSDLPLQLIELGRKGIQLGLDQCARLVDQVDRLIRQEPVGDIAVRQSRRCDQRTVCDLDAVEHLVALL